jgi:hypothetical protein
MCVDFMSLNKFCPQDPFPLPRIDQIMDSTAGCELGMVRLTIRWVKFGEECDGRLGGRSLDVSPLRYSEEWATVVWLLRLFHFLK